MAQDDDYKKIPLKVLKRELPDLKKRGRQPYIDEMKSVNPDKLNRLAAYFAMNKASSMFIFKPIINEDNLSLSKENLLRLRDSRIDDEKGGIYIIKDVTVDDIRKEAYISIDGYTSKKTLRAVRPETLRHFSEDYRKDYTMGLIVHIDTAHVECRTGYDNRALLASKIFSKAVYNSDGKFATVVLDKDKQNQINQTAKAKKATIAGFQWGGCETIHLEGEDVERTIEEFKRKRIDFTGMGATISLDNRRSDEGFCFFSNGKITFKGTEYPFDELKNVL